MNDNNRPRAAVLPAPHGRSHSFYPQRRSHLAAADRPMVERRAVPRERVSGEATTYSQPGRPWKVVPMAILAVIAIILLVNGVGGFLRSNFPVPDPAKYFDHVIDRAEAATR